jgi:hypothetical protein
MTIIGQSCASLCASTLPWKRLIYRAHFTKLFGNLGCDQEASPSAGGAIERYTLVTGIYEAAFHHAQLQWLRCQDRDSQFRLSVSGFATLIPPSIIVLLSSKRTVMPILMTIICWTLQFGSVAVSNHFIALARTCASDSRNSCRINSSQSGERPNPFSLSVRLGTTAHDDASWGSCQ